MRRKALGKHGWSISGGLLLYLAVGGPAHAAPSSVAAQLAIGNPEPHSLVGGRITMSVGYNQGVSHITAFTVYVDDKIQYSRSFLGGMKNGIQYMDLDTRTLSDGNHTVKVVAMGVRGVLAEDQVDLTIRNGVVGGVDLVPPLVQFRGLHDGQEVSGKINLDVLAEDNATVDLLVSIFVNRQPRLLKNRPPYTVELDTAEYLDPKTKTGSIMLEAWAYDKANNLGKAKPITLKVVPVTGIENATTKQGDPTKPAATGPDISPPMPAGGMKEPDPMPAGPTGDVKVDVRSTKPGSHDGTARPVTGPMPADEHYGPVSPPPVSSTGGSGTAVGGGRSTLPGGRPDSHALRGPGRLAAPPSARGATGGGSLAQSRSQTPGHGGPGSPRMAAQRAHGVSAPNPVHSGGTGQLSSAGSRSTQPPTRMALNTLANVPGDSGLREPTTVTPSTSPSGNPSTGPRETMPAGPKAVAPGATVGPRGGLDSDRVGEPVIEPMGSVTPMPSQGSARGQMPSVVRSHPHVAAPKTNASQPAIKHTPVAHSNDGPVVVMRNPNAKPDARGKEAMEVYRLADVLKRMGPQDRSYRVHQGDTVLSIARRFKVTPRCIQVANSLTNSRTLRAGATIRIPGTYDVVMDNRQVAFDVTPRIEEGIPLTPFRQIMEHAGGVVVWYPDTREVKAASDQKEIKLQIGSKEAKVNEVVIVMDRAAFLDSGRTIVPMSFMEKALDLKAEYDIKSKTVMLVHK